MKLSAIPVLLTSFVNKSGSIGLSLLPVLIVQAHYSVAESSLIMSAVKLSGLAAILISGALADLIGLRSTVLWAFFCAALGLSFLPLHWGFTAFLTAGVLAQTGITAVNSTLRLVLTQSVRREDHKEALGWMRAVNNLGQILSFSLASIASGASGFGAALLIWFDAATSFAALVLGARILPRAEKKTSSVSPTSTQVSPLNSKRRTQSNAFVFAGCTLILLGWNFMYEFYMGGVAGKLQLLFPANGIRYFSFIMVINTFFCAALAVPAARFLKQAVPTLSAAILLTGAGLWLGVRFTDRLPLLCLAAFCITLGEVAYGAFGQYLLIQSLPQVKHENLLYSAAIWVANLGKIAAAGLVFPLIIRAPVSANQVAYLFCALTVGASLIVLFLIRNRLPQ